MHESMLCNFYMLAKNDWTWCSSTLLSYIASRVEKSSQRRHFLAIDKCFVQQQQKDWATSFTFSLAPLQRYLWFYCIYMSLLISKQSAHANSFALPYWPYMNWSAAPASERKMDSGKTICVTIACQPDATHFYRVDRYPWRANRLDVGWAHAKS